MDDLDLGYVQVDEDIGFRTALIPPTRSERAHADSPRCSETHPSSASEDESRGATADDRRCRTTGGGVSPTFPAGPPPQRDGRSQHSY